MRSRVQGTAKGCGLGDIRENKGPRPSPPWRGIDFSFFFLPFSLHLSSSSFSFRMTLLFHGISFSFFSFGGEEGIGGGNVSRGSWQCCLLGLSRGIFVEGHRGGEGGGGQQLVQYNLFVYHYLANGNQGVCGQYIGGLSGRWGGVGGLFGIALVYI